MLWVPNPYCATEHIFTDPRCVIYVGAAYCSMSLFINDSNFLVVNYQY